jgi:hypothetical protein
MELDTVGQRYIDWNEPERDGAPVPSSPARRLRVVPDGAEMPADATGGVVLPRCPFAHRGADHLPLCRGYQAISVPEAESHWVYRLPSLTTCAHLGTQHSRRGGRVTACSHPEWDASWRR